MKKPWMKFYPSDWRADEALRSCSIAARGLWVEMMALMHAAENYGSLLINGNRPDKKRLAILAGISEKECTELLLELEGVGVFSRDEDGTIYSRRMRRDEEKARKHARDGSLGGNPKLKGWVNPPDNPPSNLDDNGGDKAQRPETRDQKYSVATATDADASNPRSRLFGGGLAKLAKLTGKGPDACRSFVGKCLKAAGDDAIVVLGLIEDAERNQVVDPSAWIAARLKGNGNENTGSKIIQAADDLRRKIASFDGPPRDEKPIRSGEGEATSRLLSNR